MRGKYLQTTKKPVKQMPFLMITGSFFLLEVFAFFFLSLDTEAFALSQLWPLGFGVLWALILSCLLRLLSAKAARVLYGLVYGFFAVYTGFQTGYYLLFSQMMWLSDFRYASEGADYADMLLTFPVLWWLGILVIIALGIGILWKFPRWKPAPMPNVLAAAMVLSASCAAWTLPEAVFLHDSSIRYAGSDYGRAQSAEAAYTNMFNTHRLYQVCGLYQTAGKDIYANTLYPLTPGYRRAQQEARAQIDGYFAAKTPTQNAMTGLLEGKNVVLVLMESMDDWMIGEHTPTIRRLKAEGISFSNFYTPGYGGIRTFNTEFCINTGSFLSSAGGYAFDFVTNHYQQSLPNQLRSVGYSAKTFHYNDPSFYSRGEFSPAMGYEDYVCYADYLPEGLEEKQRTNLLYDDLLLFDNAGLNGEFFREGQPNLNFIITRSAHLSYKYNEVLSYWGLKKYPEYRDLTGNEETDCAYLKAKLVDDLFARLLAELQEKGQLENTVIIGVTDHYTYGYKDMDSLYTLSGTEEDLLLEKTPCFLWSQDLEPMQVEKLLNTADLLPTVLNLLGVESEYPYMGSDAFDPNYEGFVPFSNGSWIRGDLVYDAAQDRLYTRSGAEPSPSAQLLEEMDETVHTFIGINNLILETDYYQK